MCSYLLPCFCICLWSFNAPCTSILFTITWSDCLADASIIAFLSTHSSSSAQVYVFWWQRFLTYVKLSLAALSPCLFVCCLAGKTRRDSSLSVCCYAGNLLLFPSSLLYLQSVWNDYSLSQSFGAGVLRPSNSSSRVSRIPHELIGAAPASEENCW